MPSWRMNLFWMVNSSVWARSFCFLMACITFDIPLVLEILCLPTAAGSSGTALEGSSQPAAQRVCWWETLYIHSSVEQFLLHQAAALPLVTPFYCRIQKYAFTSIFIRTLNDDQRCLRRLVSFVEGRTLNTAITVSKVAEECPFSPV